MSRPGLERSYALHFGARALRSWTTNFKGYSSRVRIMILPCQCSTEPGRSCPRYPGRNMAGNTYRLCRTREDYRKLWDAGPQPLRPKCITLPIVVHPGLEWARWPGPIVEVMKMGRPVRCRYLGKRRGSKRQFVT